MPPRPTWFAGRAAIGAFLQARVLREPGVFRVTPTAANGQPALASYVHAGDGVYRAYAIQVLTVARSRITRITSFIDPGLFATFGLPPALPAGAPAPGRPPKTLTWPRTLPVRSAMSCRLLDALARPGSRTSLDALAGPGRQHEVIHIADGLVTASALAGAGALEIAVHGRDLSRAFLSTAGDCFLDGREADPFLFQADGRAVRVRNEVGVKG